MALYTVKGSHNIPENAVRLRRSEALAYQKEIVRDWKNSTDVIFLRYGKFFAAGLACVSAHLVTKHLRKSFNLGTSFLILTYLPVYATSGLLTIGFEKNITSNVLVMKLDCPLCWQLKYGFQQSIAGVLLPFTYGSISCSYFAALKQTINVPDLFKERKLYFELISKIYKSGALKMHILVSLHILSAFFWPYMQNIEITNIRNSMIKEQI